MLFIHYLKTTAKRAIGSPFRPVLPVKCSSSSSIIKSESNPIPRHAVPFKQPNKPSKQIKVILYRYPAIEESRPLQSNPSQTGIEA
jgi:hypothetical protein